MRAHFSVLETVKFVYVAITVVKGWPMHFWAKMTGLLWQSPRVITGNPLALENDNNTAMVRMHYE